jgi:hypothetical protein
MRDYNRNFFKKTIWLLLVLSLSRSASAYAGSQEQLVKKLVYAGADLARGNKSGALNRALPNKGWKVHKARVNVYGTRAGFVQPLIPSKKIPGTPFNFYGNYDAQTQLNSGRPHLGQNINTGLNGKYFRNTTTFWPKKWK